MSRPNPDPLPNGVWRRAAKAHRCRAWWGRCSGDGRIAAGARYFDTGELACDPGRTPYATHRCCAACANAAGYADAAPERLAVGP